LKAAAGAVALNDEDAVDHELGAWREEIRRHSLAGLTRRAPKPPRIVRIGALVLLLLVHAVLLIGLRDAMRPKFTPDESAIEVLLIDALQPEPPPPVPESAPRRVMPQANMPKPMASQIDAAPTPSPEPEPDPSAPNYRVFNTDGSLIIPPDTANQTGNPALQASFIPQSTASSPIMRHRRPLKVRPNHFAQNWRAAPDETLLGAFVREHLTADTQFMTPWGTLVKCGVVVFLGGCTWGPPPGWKPAQTWRPASALDEE